MRSTISRVLLGALFIMAGVNHFVRPAMYRSIMPDYLPWHGPLVLLSGIAEILLGGSVLFRRFDAFSRWGLTALLIAVFPANVQMVMDAEHFTPIPVWMLWVRLPLQVVLIWWVWMTTSTNPTRDHS